MGAGSKTGASVDSSQGPDDSYEWEYAQPINQSKWDRARIFVYNPSTGAILGRTPAGWGKLVIFYGAFYIVLAAMFTLCMKGLMSTIDVQSPAYTLSESLIGSNPGMGFRPMPSSIEDGSVIWFNASNADRVKYWSDNLDSFLAAYHEENAKKKAQRQICRYGSEPAPEKACAVDVGKNAMGPCTQAAKYGFPNSAPCVFLKLNRIYGWVPEYYNDSSSLPEDMPDSLKDTIKKISVEKKSKLNTVWVSCEGENAADKETMGEIDFYPQPGFPGYYYPYMNVEGYLSPLVAVHFKRPARNQMINIECRVWAKNVIYGKSSQGREGSVRFEIMID